MPEGAAAKKGITEPLCRDVFNMCCFLPHSLFVSFFSVTSCVFLGCNQPSKDRKTGQEFYFLLKPVKKNILYLKRTVFCVSYLLRPFEGNAKVKTRWVIYRYSSVPVPHSSFCFSFEFSLSRPSFLFPSFYPLTTWAATLRYCHMSERQLPHHSSLWLARPFQVGELLPDNNLVWLLEQRCNWLICSPCLGLGLWSSLCRCVCVCVCVYLSGGGLVDVE